VSLQLAYKLATVNVEHSERQARLSVERLQLQNALKKLENQQKLETIEYQISARELMGGDASVHDDVELPECVYKHRSDPEEKVLGWISDNENTRKDAVSPTVLLGAQGLPKLEIKKFDGNPEDWPEFDLSFRNLIDANPCLTQSQKLGYLKTFLGKDPTSSIFGLHQSVSRVAENLW
jgi:hypothetical protein